MQRRGSFYKRLALLAFAILTIYIFTIAAFQFAFGTQTPFMVVISNSMYPTLKINDIIVVKSVAIEDIREGDIIVFKSPINPKIPIVHRVVKIVEEPGGVRMFITKGDNNPSPDPWTVTPEFIIGKVVYVIPSVGVIPKILNAYPTLKYALAITILAIIVVSEYLDYKKSKENETMERDVEDMFGQEEDGGENSELE